MLHNLYATIAYFVCDIGGNLNQTLHFSRQIYYTITSHNIADKLVLHEFDLNMTHM